MVGGYVIIPLEVATRAQMLGALTVGASTKIAGISEKALAAAKSNKLVIIQASEKEFGTSSCFPVTVLSYDMNSVTYGGVFIGKSGGVYPGTMTIKNDTVSID